MDFHQIGYAVLVMVLIALIGFGVQWLTAWKATAAAAKYPLLGHLADIGVRVGNDALALLRANPTLTPAAALAWGVQELKATAPDTVKQLGEDASDQALNNLVRRNMITTAQASVLDDAANKVITDLAPTVLTAKVTPPVVKAVTADVLASSPTLEAVIEQVLAKMGKNTSYTVGTVTAPNPAASAASPSGNLAATFPPGGVPVSTVAT